MLETLVNAKKLAVKYTLDLLNVWEREKVSMTLLNQKFYVQQHNVRLRHRLPIDFLKLFFILRTLYFTSLQ